MSFGLSVGSTFRPIALPETLLPFVVFKELRGPSLNRCDFQFASLANAGRSCPLQQRTRIRLFLLPDDYEAWLVRWVRSCRGMLELTVEVPVQQHSVGTYVVALVEDSHGLKSNDHSVDLHLFEPLTQVLAAATDVFCILVPLISTNPQNGHMARLRDVDRNIHDRAHFAQHVTVFLRKRLQPFDDTCGLAKTDQEGEQSVLVDGLRGPWSETLGPPGECLVACTRADRIRRSASLARR